VLRGVTLAVRRGETLCVIGESGCGKTVLLKHVIGLLAPDRGRVMFDGYDLSTVSPRGMIAVRTRFWMVFQRGALFDSLTVGENVALGLVEHTDLSTAEIDAIVADRLHLVGMSRAVHKKPSELSGGMKKRVGLARAIAMDPEVILYDEPTTGLDPIMADVINVLIRSLQKRLKATSITVTHDMTSAAKVADRIAMLHQGRIVFEGTVEEVWDTKDPVVQQFVRGQAEGPIKAV